MRVAVATLVLMISGTAFAATFDPSHVPVAGNGGKGFKPTDFDLCRRLRPDNNRNHIALVGPDGEGFVVDQSDPKWRQYLHDTLPRCDGKPD